MEKFIETLKGATAQGKRIIVVGNKPLSDDYGELIDSYDIVIRFSQSPYMIATNPEFRRKYGSKISYVFMNRAMYQLLNTEMNHYHLYLQQFGKPNLLGLKAALLERKTPILTIATKRDPVSYCLTEQRYDAITLEEFVSASARYLKQLNDRLLISSSQSSDLPCDLPCDLPFKLPPGKSPLAGTFMILTLYTHGIPFDLIGFNCKDPVYRTTYDSLKIRRVLSTLNEEGEVIEFDYHNMSVDRRILSYLIEEGVINNLEGSGVKPRLDQQSTANPVVK